MAVPTTSIESLVRRIWGFNLRMRAESSTTKTRTGGVIARLRHLPGLQPVRIATTAIRSSIRPGIGTSPTGPLHGRRKIQNQYDPYRRQGWKPRSPIGVDGLIVEALITNSSSPSSASTINPSLRFTGGDHQDKDFAARVLRDLRPTRPSRTNCNALAAQLQYFVFVHSVNFRFQCAGDLVHGVQRNRIDRCSTRNRNALMMASVRGSFRRKVVPWPGRFTISTEPFNRWRTLRTTSKPTPRPEISLICDAVLNPGRKTTSRTPLHSGSCSPATANNSCSMALSFTRCRSMPRPSSPTSMTT